MSKCYSIFWKSKVNGRSGLGTIRFDQEDAEKLAEELNREFPEIQHEARHLAPEGGSEPTPPVPLVDGEPQAA